MEIVFQSGFIIIMFLLIFITHSWIGSYPVMLPRSLSPEKGIIITLLLWSIALIIPIIRIFYLTPWLSGLISDRFFIELVYLPVVIFFYFFLPGYITVRTDKWTARDFGLTWRTRSKGIVVFAITFGFVSGFVAHLTSQAVISDDPISAGTLLLLLINNDIAEEFFHRGIIQSRLERILGQNKAILLGGILFGLTHIAFDLTELLYSGIIYVIFAFLLQTMLGWLLGVIYIKTRSLWPGIALHFLINWMPSILAGLSN